MPEFMAVVISDVLTKGALPTTTTLRSLASREGKDAIEKEKPSYYLNYAEAKLLGVVGVSFHERSDILLYLNPS